MKYDIIQEIIEKNEKKEIIDHLKLTVKDTLDILTYKKKFKEENKEEKHKEENKEENKEEKDKEEKDKEEKNKEEKNKEEKNKEEKYKEKIFDYALKQYNKLKIKDEKQIKLWDNIDRLKQDYIASLIFLAFNLEKF